MLITGVRLQNYRSYKDQAFELEPGVNIVVGPNASGKTNLLEAVYLAAQGKSFRNGDKDLIAYKKPWARVDLIQGNKQRSVKLFRDKPRGKEFEIAGKSKKRLKPEDKLPIVLFTPDDLRSLSGSPRKRRQLIDSLVGALSSEGAKVMGRYQRALIQRNNLLKQDSPNPDEIFVWGVKLGDLGGQLADMRMVAVREINKHASEVYSQLASKKQKIKFSYVSELGKKKDYRHNFDKHLQSKRDLLLGFTSLGPHRDDLLVEIDGHDAKSAASRGELRTLVLVAKIVEIKVVENKAKTKPLLLLDDVFSELDGARRRQLSKKVGKYQTIITTTDADAVMEHFGKISKILPIAMN